MAYHVKNPVLPQIFSHPPTHQSYPHVKETTERELKVDYKYHHKGDFPHKTPYASRRQKRLATQNPDLTTSNFQLKHQQYDVLNAIFRRCLLEHDFPRASRALGTLLRFELGRTEYSIRNKHLWALGAEILLRRHSETNVQLARSAELDLGQPESIAVHQSHSDSSIDPISPLKGFEVARDYLSRLTIQYPDRWHSSTNSSAREFWPIFISLWILQIQTESQRSLNILQSKSGSSDETGSTSSSSESSDTSTTETQIQEAKQRTLRQAKEVKAKLDEVLIDPAFDRHSILLSLRSQVEQWIRDLADDTSEQSEDSDMEST